MIFIKKGNEKLIQEGSERNILNIQTTIYRDKSLKHLHRMLHEAAILNI